MNCPDFKHMFPAADQISYPPSGNRKHLGKTIDIEHSIQVKSQRQEGCFFTKIQVFVNGINKNIKIMFFCKREYPFKLFFCPYFPQGITGCIDKNKLYIVFANRFFYQSLVNEASFTQGKLKSLLENILGISR